MYENGVFKTKWMEKVKNILDKCGLSHFWNQGNNINVKWLELKVKQTLKDQFIQEWHTKLQNSNKSINYRIYKTDFEFEDYLTKLPNVHRVALCRFRLGCTKLPVQNTYCPAVGCYPSLHSAQ